MKNKKIIIFLSLIFVFMFAAPLAIFLMPINLSPTTKEDTTPVVNNPIVEEEQEIVQTNTLPAEYTQVEHIKSTGKQFIDTEIYATETTEITMQIKFENHNSLASSTGNYFFGCSNIENQNVFTASFGPHIDENKYNVSFWFDLGYAYANGESPPSMTSQTIIENPNTLFFTSGKVSWGGYYRGKQTTSYEKTDYSLYLFGRNGSESYVFERWEMVLYNCRIYEDGEVVRDYIPCYRNSDKVAGLYDLVSEAFFTSETEENFSIGEKIETRSNIRNRDDYFYDNYVTLASLEDEWSGDGSLANPYIIKSTDAFYFVSKYSWASKYVELQSDIILNEEEFNEDGTVAIGDGIIYQWKSLISIYLVSLNGNNHTIYGLYFKDENSIDGNAGLFGNNRANIVENLNLANFFVSGKRYVSPMAHTANILRNCTSRSGFVITETYAGGFSHLIKEKAENCKNYATVIATLDGTQSNVAGITCFAAENSVIKNCYNYGNIQGNINVAGIVSYVQNSSIIEDCNNYGLVQARTYHLAGIVSFPHASIVRRCNNYGKIEITKHSGNTSAGICGVAHRSLEIVDCNNYGEIVSLNSSTDDGGQIIAYVQPDKNQIDMNIKIKNCNGIDELINLYCIYIYIKELQLFL